MDTADKQRKRQLNKQFKKIYRELTEADRKARYHEEKARPYREKANRLRTEILDTIAQNAPIIPER